MFPSCSSAQVMVSLELSNSSENFPTATSKPRSGRTGERCGDLSKLTVVLPCVTYQTCPVVPAHDILHWFLP